MTKDAVHLETSGERTEKFGRSPERIAGNPGKMSEMIQGAGDERDGEQSGNL